MGILDAGSPVFNVRGLDREDSEIGFSAFSGLEAAQAYRDELKTTRFVYGIWITTLDENGEWVFVEEWKMDDSGHWQQLQPRNP